MSYESKIIFADRYEHLPNEAYGREICQFDMCVINYLMIDGKFFHELFTRPIDFDLNENGDVWGEQARIDKYGVHCKWATVDELIKWLEEFKKEDDYRRAELLLSFLYTLQDQINNGRWNQICIVHYGY